MAIRNTLPHPPRFYGNRFRKTYDIKGDDAVETWRYEVFALDTLQYNPKGKDAHTYLLDYIASLHDSIPTKLPEGLEHFVFTLLMTILLSVFLIFCLVYQILTIRKQRHIEAIRQEFLHTMIHELKRPISTLKMCVSFMGNERMMQVEEGKSAYPIMASASQKQNSDMCSTSSTAAKRPFPKRLFRKGLSMEDM